MPSWVERATLVLDVDQPVDRRLASIPEEAVVHARRLLEAVRREFPATVKGLADVVRLRTANRFHAEAAAAAEHVGVSWRDIILANVCYDLLLATFGCSTAALATADGPVLARNMDFWPEDLLARATWGFRYARGDQGLVWLAGWPGGVGAVTGMSHTGRFALALNAAVGADGTDKTGYPVLLFLRCVLEDASGFEHALHLLSRQRLAASALITLVGMHNHQRVVIERTCRRHALRWPEGDAPLIATNDYRLLDQPPDDPLNPLYRTACSRFDSLGGFCTAFAAEGRVPDEALLYALTDPTVIQSITAQHVIMRPREGTGRVFIPRRFVEAPTV